MQEVYTELKKLGGDVVALSVDDVQSAVDMKDAYDLEFPVLYDTDASVVRQWELYDLLGDGLSAPATFIIRTDGTVESALIGQTIADRPTTDSILETLASLAGMNRAAMAEAPPEPEPETKPAKEIGGRGGLDPTRYGDWEKGGRAVDF